MGKGRNYLVLKPCDKEHTLRCVTRGKGRRTVYAVFSQELLHGNTYVWICFQCEEGSQQYCEAVLLVLNCGQSFGFKISFFSPPN